MLFGSGEEVRAEKEKQQTENKELREEQKKAVAPTVIATQA